MSRSRPHISHRGPGSDPAEYGVGCTAASPSMPRILLGAALVIVGVVVSGVADRFRFPGLVLFLVLGMAVADDGLALIHFDDARLAQNVAIIALSSSCSKEDWPRLRTRFAEPACPQPCWPRLASRSPPQLPLAAPRLVFDLPASTVAADRSGRRVDRRGRSVQRTCAARRCRPASATCCRWSPASTTRSR